MKKLFISIILLLIFCAVIFFGGAVLKLFGTLDGPGVIEGKALPPKAVENRAEISANIDGATQIGKLAGEVAVAAGIKSAVFDRSGTRYHGKIKALADAAREVGLNI